MWWSFKQMLDFLQWKVTETDITKLKFHGWQIKEKKIWSCSEITEIPINGEKNQNSVKKN